jgi:hypothetical protein
MIISGTNLSMTRGDSESITVKMVDGDGASIVFATGDTVYLTVRSDTASSTVALQKVISTFEVDGSAIIPIDHSDTQSMEFKKYVYDIQWTKQDGTVMTIVKPSVFEITKEVTYD